MKLSTLSSKWPQLALLAVAETLAMSLWFSSTAVVPQLTERYSLSDSGQSWLTMSVQLGFVLGALLSALTNLSDRYRADRVFAISAILGAAANGAIPLFEPDLGIVMGLRAITGMCLAGVYPTGMKLMATWFDRGRGLAIGVLVAALTVGSASPHLFNMIAAVADGSGQVNWREIMLAASASGLLAGLLALAVVRTGPLLPAARKFSLLQAGAIVRDPPVRLANLGYLGHMWELYAWWAWMPGVLLGVYRAHAHPDWLAYLMGFATFAIGAAGCVIAGRWADRRGRTLVTSWSLGVSGVCCLLAWLVLDSPVLLTALCLVWGFAIIADSAQYSTAVSELSDPQYVGTALTAQTCLGFLLTTASIRLLPRVAEYAGWGAAFAILAIGPAIGLWAMLRLRRRPEATRMAGGMR